MKESPAFESRRVRTQPRTVTRSPGCIAPLSTSTILGCFMLYDILFRREYAAKK